MNDSPAVSLSFRSDNVATVAPEILRALDAANHGLAASYCDDEAHINTAEGGATEAFSGGAKLIALPGANGKLEPPTLAAALRRADRGITNRPQPDAVSITQASEYGTVYAL